jgi:predicted DNA binding CopG/RHH family protein
MNKKHKLDAYEQDIEEHFENLPKTSNKGALINKLQSAAKEYLQDKKPITIRVSVHDIEAIKIKASKAGVPYQTYINMLIHKEATSL